MPGGSDVRGDDDQKELHLLQTISQSQSRYGRHRVSSLQRADVSVQTSGATKSSHEGDRVDDGLVHQLVREPVSRARTRRRHIRPCNRRRHGHLPVRVHDPVPPGCAVRDTDAAT